MSRASYELVKEAFKAMRKRGYIARSGFMCCRSCAGCAIANDVEAMTEEARSKVLGVVLTTKQDVEDVETRKTLWVGFGPVGTSKFGDVGQEAVEVGGALRAELLAAGVVHDWDGDPASCICVDLAATDRKIEAEEEALRAKERAEREAVALRTLPMTVDVPSIVRFILTQSRVPESLRRDYVLGYFAPGDRERVARVVDAVLADRGAR